MKYRAQRMKAKWDDYNQQYLNGEPTTLNFGRISLEEYLNFHYKKYKDLCFFCNEDALNYGKWLLVE